MPYVINCGSNIYFKLIFHLFFSIVLNLGVIECIYDFSSLFFRPAHPLASHGIVSLDTEDSLIDAKIVGDKIIIAAGTRIRPTFHRLNLFGSDENLISRASIQADGRLIDLVSRNETEQVNCDLSKDYVFQKRVM